MLFALCKTENCLGLDDRVLLGESIVLLDILGLPGIADPDILGSNGSVVATTLHHIGGQNALLGLVLVLNGKRDVSMAISLQTQTSMWGYARAEQRRRS